MPHMQAVFYRESDESEPVDEFIDVVLPRIEWPLAPTRPAFCQGAIAGVPAKLYIDTTGAATVFVMTSYLDDFLSRLPVAT